MVASSQFPEFMLSQPPATLFRRLHAKWLGVDSSKSFLGYASREAFPIVAYCGANGAGKSAAAVYDCLPVLRGKRWGPCRNTGHPHMHATGCAYNPVTGNGCSCLLRGTEPTSDYQGALPPGATTEGQYVVWSTTRLLDGQGRTSQHYRPLRTLGDLARIEHAVLLLDEVPGIADARDHQALPAQIRKAIAEMRRRDVRVLWTCPDFSSADSRLRQITQAVVQARGLARVRTPGSMWTQSQVLRWSTYDRSEFDRFTRDARERIQPLGVQFVWRPGHLLERSYDTLAPVISLSVATESGACMACGGSRPRPKCGCPMPDEGIEVLPGVREVEGERGTRRRILAPLDLPDEGAVA